MQEEISFGIWLRKQRRALDLTRQAFAHQVGCAEVTLRRIEAGTLKPSRELAGLILEKLGVSELERSQWISFARGNSGFPRPATAANKPITNLPAPLTTFIGREQEQADVTRLIAKYRMVTLTGSGGVGKTRLSLRVGEQTAGQYPHGVWLVELAAVLDPALLWSVTARALGLRDDPQRPIIDLLCDYLSNRSMLLILDNCEHLLDACAQFIFTLLGQSYHLTVLATSREPLGVTGEALYRVPSLSVPDLKQWPAGFGKFESFKLFEERAQRVQFDFLVTEEHALSIAQICNRLDGIPLAIELAAAKVGMFSVETIASQLEESFNLLTGGDRTVLPRHQTLRASIDWSWGLLTDSEQRLMSQLSVFAGGWTLEAAQCVGEGDVLYLLNSLVTKSLVVMNRRSETDVRYSFHEIIRQYAQEKLLEAGAMATLRDKHLAYLVRLVEQAEPELYRSNQVFWFKKLEDELDNFRKALDWALEKDVESGLRIAAVPWQFWDKRNHLHELGGWLRRLLEYYPTPDSLRARALAVYSQCLQVQGDFVEAGEIAMRGLKLARVLSDRQNEALCLLFLGGSFMFQGHHQQGTPFLEQSLALYRALEDKVGQAKAMSWLSESHSEPEHAKTLLWEALELNRDLGNLGGTADCLKGLALQAILTEDLSPPLPWLEEARNIYHELGDRANEALLVEITGTLAYWQGKYQKAVACVEESIILYENTGVWWSAWSRSRLGYIYLRQGNIAQARQAFESSLQQFKKYESVVGLTVTIEGLSILHMNYGQPERAARLIGWVEAMREQNGDIRPRLEQNSLERDLAILQAKLAKAQLTRLLEEGRAMTVEQAVTLALEPA
jgi:non-specific serine/threonine protein kinase